MKWRNVTHMLKRFNMRYVLRKCPLLIAKFKAPPAAAMWQALLFCLSLQQHTLNSNSNLNFTRSRLKKQLRTNLVIPTGIG